MKQERRNKLFSLTLSDLERCAQNYFTTQQVSFVSVLGSQEIASTLNDQWTIKEL
jgi:Zn-dependent M16 (insulinase) family peptidase